MRPAHEDFGSASQPEGNVTASANVFAGERVWVKFCCGREHRPRHDAAALDPDIDTRAINVSDVSFSDSAIGGQCLRAADCLGYRAVGFLVVRPLVTFSSSAT